MGQAIFLMLGEERAVKLRALVLLGVQRMCIVDAFGGRHILQGMHTGFPYTSTKVFRKGSRQATVFRHAEARGKDPRSRAKVEERMQYKDSVLNWSMASQRLCPYVTRFVPERTGWQLGRRLGRRLGEKGTEGVPSGGR